MLMLGSEAKKSPRRKIVGRPNAIKSAGALLWHKKIKKAGFAPAFIYALF